MYFSGFVNDLKMRTNDTPASLTALSLYDDYVRFNCDFGTKNTFFITILILQHRNLTSTEIPGMISRKSF